jgi:hypothetical protein
VSDVLDRLRAPRVSAPSARRDSVASVWVRGAFAASWVVAVGLAALVVLALVLWAADSQSSANAAGAMRLAAQLWLLAQRTPLRINGGALTIPPLGLTLLLALLLARATAIVTRASNCTERGDLGIVVASVTAPYAVLATAVAALSPSSSIRPSVGAAFVCAVIVGGVSATTGAVRASGLRGELWRALPLDLRAAFEAVGAAVAVLIGAATVLTVGSLLAHGHEFWATLRTYHGSAGEVSMVVLSLLLLPNAVMFSLAYLVGPGFAVGAGSSVALGGSHVGAMPALPLLAAVPTGRAPLPVLLICIAAVVLAGVAAGWRLVRRPALGLANRVRSGLLAGAALGIGAAVLVGLAGGPAGPGRLSAVGPSPWQVGLTVAVEVAVISLIVVLAAAWAQRGRRTTTGR